MSVAACDQPVWVSEVSASCWAIRAEFRKFPVGAKMSDVSRNAMDHPIRMIHCVTALYPNPPDSTLPRQTKDSLKETVSFETVSFREPCSTQPSGAPPQLNIEHTRPPGPDLTPLLFGSLKKAVFRDGFVQRTRHQPISHRLIRPHHSRPNVFGFTQGRRLSLSGFVERTTTRPIGPYITKPYASLPHGSLKEAASL